MTQVDEKGIVNKETCLLTKDIGEEDLRFKDSREFKDFLGIMDSIMEILQIICGIKFMIKYDGVEHMCQQML